MRVQHDSSHASIENDLVRLEATLRGDRIGLLLSALRSDGSAVPVLERTGQTTGPSPLRVEAPEECRIEVDDLGSQAAIVVAGKVPGGRFYLDLRLREGSPWLAVVETLVAEPDRRALPPVEYLEAEWRFVGWRQPGEVFSPGLVPEPDDVVGRHMMRSPALLAQLGDLAAALVVDVDSIARTQALPAAMSLLRYGDAPVFRTGLRPHRVRDHVYFESVPEAVGGESAAPYGAPAGQGIEALHHSYHLFCEAEAPAGRAVEAARRLLWERWGRRSLAGGQPLPMSGDDYALQIYPRILDRLWAETTLDGRWVGAVRANRSYESDVWFCAWFNQLRSAYGLYLWGQRLGNADWQARALATRDLVLAAPQRDGLFPTVFVFGDTPERCRWVESHHQGGGPGIYHLMDCSWTAYHLLRWHRDLVPDERSVEFARRYAKGLVALQRPDGGLPAWIEAGPGFNPVTRVDHEALLADLATQHSGGDAYVPRMLRDRWVTERYVESAEDGASLLFLAELARTLPEGDPDREAALRSARAIADWLEAWVYPDARWIDFEVYFSCSPKPLDFFDGRSGQWPQNNLCIHFAAAGLLALFEVTQDPRHLTLARRAMDRLCLYQQVWDPSWLGFYAFGGYGVQNTDGEWTDARQAQFADTHLDFYRATGEWEHLERARAAAKAGLVTVFLPGASAVYPTGWHREPRGQAAENHAHGGYDHLSGVSGFDWGSGSALATVAYLHSHGVEIEG